MPTMPTGYYSRFDASKNYEEHLFRSGLVLQSAELNEVQKNSAHRLKSVADALFKDGNIIRDGRISIDSLTGVVQCESGAVYLRGAVRGVPPASFTVPIVGTISVGVRLVDTVITDADDPDIRDPAVGLRNYREPGAARLKTDATWGWDGDAAVGEFYPIYWIDAGQLRPKEAPPQIDMVSLSLAKYDRDSAGGTYVVSGLNVAAEEDVGGNQVYSIAEGRARVYGHPIDLQTSLRVIFDAQPFARLINVEPHTAIGGTERVDTNRKPIASIAELQIVKEIDVSIVHGAFLGAVDPTGYTSVLQIIGVKGGGTTYDNSPTTYVAGTSYLLTADAVDWSPGGAEPSTGATYHVRLRYMATVAPDSQDQTGFEVTGAVIGTQILVSYSYYVPRIDRLCFNRDGQVVWLKGVPADYNAWPPEVTRELLPLALVYQSWDASRRVVPDGARMVPMDELALIQSKLDRLISLTAQERLKGDAILRDQTLKKSVFVDPLLDDTMRDDGQVQTASIVGGILMLAIDGEVATPDDDVLSPQVLAHNQIVSLSQASRTGCMLINPYMAFEPIPATVKLTPAIDRWTETVEVWTSPVTEAFTSGAGSLTQTFTTVRNITLSKSSERAMFLRQISIRLRAEGFGPNEEVTSVKFDGLTVTATQV